MTDVTSVVGLNRKSRRPKNRKRPADVFRLDNPGSLTERTFSAGRRNVAVSLEAALSAVRSGSIPANKCIVILLDERSEPSESGHPASTYNPEMFVTGMMTVEMLGLLDVTMCKIRRVMGF